MWKRQRRSPHPTSGRFTRPDAPPSLSVDGVFASLDVRVGDERQVTVRVDHPHAADSEVEVVSQPGGDVLVRPRCCVASPVHHTIVADVPHGATVALHDVTGTATIGDTEGRLHLDLDGDVEVRAGRVADATIRAGGSSQVEIAHVGGDCLDVDVIGPARTRVLAAVARIRARVQGSGNVLVRGTADEAELDVRGSGFISVQRVRHTLARRCIGSGDAVVAMGPSPADERLDRLEPFHDPAGSSITAAG